LRNIVVMFVFMIALSACNPGGSNQTGGADSAGKDKKASQEVVFPEVMPDYVARYPGAKVVKAPGLGIADMMFKGLGGGGAAAFSTTDMPEKVLAFYKDDFTKKGLEEGNSETKTGDPSLAFVKPGADGGVVIVTATPAGSIGTIVQIMYLPTPDETKK
jgi:hypothetical protein